MLVNRNITVGRLRTSVRLEPEFWVALTDIADREGMVVDQLCTLIDSHLGQLGRTAGIRVFIASYFAAEKEKRRHERVDHGLLQRTSQPTSERRSPLLSRSAFA